MASKIIYVNYWHFSRRYAQIEKLCYFCQHILKNDHCLSDVGKKKLVSLNRKRIDLQKEVGEITQLHSSICEKCMGVCCRGHGKYFFTAVDFWLRKFSSNPVSDIGHIADRQWYFYLNRRFQQVVSRINLGEKDQRDFCQYLGENGCKLNVDDKPIKCIVATCKKIRQAMDAPAKSEYAKLIYELYLVALGTFDILKNEARVPASFGRVSLLLTP